MIHYPTLKLIYDRHKRASNTKEGAIELRITHQRQQRFATTGIRVLPRQWRDGRIVNRLDALELQQALNAFVLNAQRIIQERVQTGTLDMTTIVADINGRAAFMATIIKIFKFNYYGRRKNYKKGRIKRQNKANSLSFIR